MFVDAVFGGVAKIVRFVDDHQVEAFPLKVGAVAGEIGVRFNMEGEVVFREGVIFVSCLFLVESPVVFQFFGA